MLQLAIIKLNGIYARTRGGAHMLTVSRPDSLGLNTIEVSHQVLP